MTISPAEYIEDGFIMNEDALYVIFDSVSKNTLGGLDISRGDLVVGYLSERKQAEAEVIMAELGIKILDNKVVEL
tara:strand:- start:843 stop:1067 length:225 start_codon:yes stop_codon:yes gene_type:complete